MREYMSAFDFDGNGTVTTDEVMTAARHYDSSKKTNKRLVKTVWLMVGGYQSDKESHIDLQDDHIDTVISHIISPYPYRSPG
jgi:hypothetical protein